MAANSNSNSVRYVNDCGYMLHNSRLMDGMVMYFSNEEDDNIIPLSVSYPTSSDDEDIDSVDWDRYYLKSDPYAECNYGDD